MRIQIIADNSVKDVFFMMPDPLFDGSVLLYVIRIWQPITLRFPFSGFNLLEFNDFILVIGSRNYIL